MFTGTIAGFAGSMRLTGIRREPYPGMRAQDLVTSKNRVKFSGPDSMSGAIAKQ